MHQLESNLGRRRTGAGRKLWARLAAVLLLAGAGGRAQAEDGPTAAMLQPVHELVEFMRALPAGRHPRVFAHGLCIVENYAPFLFCGAGAAAAWEAGFRAHAAGDELGDLTAAFGARQDFAVAGRRAYFSLPTTWTGLTHGRRFEEHGAWAFVLERQAGAWRIKGYGWGVTSYTEFPP